MAGGSRFGVPMTADQYADQWQMNSAGFKGSGDYEWMDEQLGDASTVLEVGCGSGNGTLALIRSGRRVVVIEPNAKLAKMTYTALEDEGVPVSCVEVSALDSKLPGGNIIIHADIFDASLEQVLAANQFDAIVCWLIGAEPARIAPHFNVAIDGFSGDEGRRYREKLHARCGEVGTLCLKPHGKIQVVDRQGFSSFDDCKYAAPDVANLYSQVLGPNYSILEGDISFRQIKTGISGSSSMQYASNQAVSGDPVLVFASVKSILN